MILALLLALQEFEDVTGKAGLVEPLKGLLGHGAAWGDIDNDGDVDLFVGGFSDRENTLPNRLFRNDGGRFVRTGQIEDVARTSGAVFADLDGDGDLDLVVANNAAGKLKQRSVLYRNDGGTFAKSQEFDLLTARNVLVLARDGRLDLLLVEDKLRNRSPKSLLMKNLGGLKFEKQELDLYGLGSAVADLNGDGKPDYFVAHANRLFVSDGRVIDFPYEPADGEDWPCGAAFGDLDRDGDFDLVISVHHDPAKILVYRNDQLTFVRTQSWEIPTKAPHCEIQDFDNDGWPDLYVSAAWEDGTLFLCRNEKGTLVPPKKSGKMSYYPAGPTADYDGDGRLDIFLVGWFGPSKLLRNVSPKRHWLQVAAPIGTKVRVGDQIREISVGNGYASGQPAVAHFGLGDLTEVEVTIGKLTKTVAADQVVRQDAEIWKFDLPDRGRGTLWSSWGDGIVASDGKYYTAIGDHRDMVKVYVLDGGLREVFSLEEKGHGKIHAALHEWKGGIWFATYWGKSKELPDGWGGYLYRYDLASGKTEKIGMLEAGRGFPASTMSGGRIYFHSVNPGEGSELLVYDLEQRKVVFTGGGDLMEGKRAFLCVDDRVYFSTKNQTLAYWDGKGIVESALRMPGPTLRASAGPFGFTQKGKLFRVDGDKVVELHDEAEYIAVMVTDGTHLYYAPGAHGSATRAGSPVVRYEIATGKRTVLCKLNGLVKDYVIGGTYNLKLGKGALYGTFNGGRGRETFGEPCVVRIPLP